MINANNTIITAQSLINDDNKMNMIINSLAQLKYDELGMDDALEMQSELLLGVISNEEAAQDIASIVTGKDCFSQLTFDSDELEEFISDHVDSVITSTPVCDIWETE